MDADARLAGVRAKLERAKEHIRTLETEIRAFFKTKPYAIGTRRDPDTRRLIYYVTNAKDIPTNLASIAGDTLHNLKGSLDHLAYQLVLFETGQPGPFTHVYFPISDDAEKYQQETPGRVKGMRGAAIDAIAAIKPYKGGNDTLWKLHKLNNVDKHRLLITVGASYTSVDIMPLIARDAPPEMKAFVEKSPLPSLFLKPADKLFPLKAGVDLFVDLPDAEPNSKIQFRFVVSFGEAQVAEGEPLLETLNEMVTVVDQVTTRLRPFLM